MRISFLQILFILCLALLFLADLPRLAKTAKENIRNYKKKEGR